MKRAVIAFAVLLAASAGICKADEPPARGCTIVGTNILTQDQGDVTIGCTGLSEAFGRQLGEVLNRILQDRLDPQMVIEKLAEVDRVPEEGVARKIDDAQSQAIIQNLVGKPSAQIAITAHPSVDDAAEFAQGIAAPLLMVGWQIDGHQIRRAAPKALDPVHGVALVVRDSRAAPEKARLLRTALAAAHIHAPLVSDPTMAPEGTLLWIGRRPVFMGPEAQK